MSEQVDSWAVVELMGHVTMAGLLSEEERFGSKVGRIDIPTNEGSFTTIFFGGSSIYRVTPVSEAIARAKARSNQPKPIYAYELPPAMPTVDPAGSLMDRSSPYLGFDDEEPDDEIDEEDER